MASEQPSSPASTRFFVLEKVLGGRHDMEVTKAEPVNRAPPLRCPECNETVGMLTWLPPYRVKLNLFGQDYADLIEGPAGELLMTERFAEAFRAQGLTGLEGFHPVEVVRVRRARRGPKPGPPPRYLLAMAPYGGAVVDEARSRLLREKPIPCTWCRSTGIDAIDGFTLEPGSWTGEDIFRPRGLWSELVVTERFARLAERHALSHLTLVPTDKFVWDPLRRFYPDPSGGAQA